MKNKYLFIIIIFFILIFCFLFFYFMKNENNINHEAKVCFNEKCFFVEIAQSNLERANGLMNRTELENDKGMLFVFDMSGIYNFWMKNTLIPLDIIWISSDKKVVFIKKNAQPCKEKICESIKPNVEAKYVLEINGGLTDTLDINEGDDASISY